jgi:hypothetical protein
MDRHTEREMDKKGRDKDTQSDAVREGERNRRRQRDRHIQKILDVKLKLIFMHSYINRNSNSH